MKMYVFFNICFLKIDFQLLLLIFSILQCDEKPMIQRSRKHLAKTEDAQDSPKGNTENYCERCDKRFSTRTNLTRHLLTHDGLKPYVCNVCGNAFTQNGSLKSHMVSYCTFVNIFLKIDRN